MTTYQIDWADGRKEAHDSYDEACEAVRAEYPEAEIGHDGDLTLGGDRTLCWADEASSEGDSGVDAIAEIMRLGDEPDDDEA